MSIYSHARLRSWGRSGGSTSTTGRRLPASSAAKVAATRGPEVSCRSGGGVRNGWRRPHSRRPVRPGGTVRSRGARGGPVQFLQQLGRLELRLALGWLFAPERLLGVGIRLVDLLEALLLQAQSSVLGGERRRIEEPAVGTVPIFLGQLSDHWRNFHLYDSTSRLGAHGEIPPWNLFLQQQLGLIEIRPRPFREKERRECGARGWLIGGARLTAWGTALTWALLEFLKEDAQDSDETETGEPARGSGELPLEIPQGDLAPAPGQPEAGQGDAPAGLASEEEDVGLDEASDESVPEARFGVLQPIFQPYFPEWQTVYAQPKSEVRTGTHIFKVTLIGWRGGGGGIWRRLAVPADTSLDGLAWAILDAFALDKDHLYDFRYRDQRGKTRVYHHPYTDDGPFTPEITVGESDLGLKDEMRFTFDYGDYWRFTVRLENVDAQPSGLTDPKVIESAGRAPEQYPSAE